MKKIRSMLVALAVVALASLGGATAAFGAGSVGTYVAGSGYCWDDHDWDYNAYDRRILATTPTMLPAPDAPQPPGFYVGPGGSQWVGFRATLLRWEPGTGWVRFRSSSLKVQETNYAWPHGDWYDKGTGTWGNGLTTFYVGTTEGGYFKLLYDLYWYANGEVSGHIATYAWGGLRDDRLSSLTTSGWSYVEWCKYA